MLTCYRCAQPPVCTRMHKNNQVRTVVHVRVWWIMKTQKDPACTLIKSGLGSATLMTQIFHGRNSHWDNKVLQIKMSLKARGLTLMGATGEAGSLLNITTNQSTSQPTSQPTNQPITHRKQEDVHLWWPQGRLAPC